MAAAGRSTSSTTTILFLLYLISISSSSSVVTSPAYQGEEQDRWALLLFKNALSSGDLLSRWSPDSGGHHCSWLGVTCHARSRVVALSVPSRPGRRLVGEMSPEVARLTELKSLSFPAHGLRGQIPGEIWQLPHLEVVNLAGNSLHGALPATFPLRLQKLDLSGNQIAGSIPPGIGSCVWLRSLRLSSNSLDGSIPQQVGKLTKLQVLDLSRNRLSGRVPPELRHCRGLVKVDLSRNLLHGQVPSSLKELKSLRILSLAWNNISGTIPSGLGQLRSLEVLDLSSNSLSGVIPIDLVALKNHTVLLLDNNELSGDVPASAPEPSFSMFNVSSVRCGTIHGNPSLQPCELFRVPARLTNARALTEVNTNPPPDVTPTGGGGSGGGLRSIEIAAITSASAIIAVLLAVVILYICTRKCASRQSRRSSRRKEVTVFMDIGAPLTYETVVCATGNFNASNCIGSGGFGATYKAEIAPGVLVAIKKLSVGRFQGVQQFQAEVKTLGRCRHPNLVTLIGFHLSDSEMFLIYNYLPGGNLERFIQERTKRPIDWRMLHKIALDIARALAYMHDDCVPRILHRDVKPSNILLDNEHNAYLSDFGLARLLGNSETHATTGVAGTFGYVAPEYAMTCRVSDKADVYSYGIVLLELISDKKALDPSFSPYRNGFNIVAWACMLLQKGRAREFFIQGLWDVAPHDDLVEILHLGIKCTVDSLSYRPTMKHVVRGLRELQPPAY